MTLFDILRGYGIDTNTLTFEIMHYEWCEDAEAYNTKEEVLKMMEENDLLIQIDTYRRNGLSTKEYYVDDIDVDVDRTIFYAEVFKI